jgi:hypothetical protein
LFVGKREGTEPSGRIRRSYEDNIKIDITEIRYKGVGCIRLVEDRDYWGPCEYHNESSVSTRLGEVVVWRINYQLLNKKLQLYS